MKKLLHLLILTICLISGCTSNNAVNEILSTCPQYFQDNIGKVIIKPISPSEPHLRGAVYPKEPENPIYLYGPIEPNIVFHEAFHSFEMRAGHNRPGEWELFYRDFHVGDPDPQYLGSEVYDITRDVPFSQDVLVKGYVRFYSTANHFEDAADCFVFYMRGRKRNDPMLMRKVQAVHKFVNGEYVLLKK